MLDLNPEGFQDDGSYFDIIKVILNKVENNKTPETKTFQEFCVNWWRRGESNPCPKILP